MARKFGQQRERWRCQGKKSNFARLCILTEVLTKIQDFAIWIGIAGVLEELAAALFRVAQVDNLCQAL